MNTIMLLLLHCYYHYYHKYSSCYCCILLLLWQPLGLKNELQFLKRTLDAPNVSQSPWDPRIKCAKFIAEKKHLKMYCNFPVHDMCTGIFFHTTVINMKCSKSKMNYFTHPSPISQNDRSYSLCGLIIGLRSVHHIMLSDALLLFNAALK